MHVYNHSYLNAEYCCLCLGRLLVSLGIAFRTFGMRSLEVEQVADAWIKEYRINETFCELQIHYRRPLLLVM